MDAYHPDFRDTIAIDLRIQKITEALGHSFKPNEYDEHERFYQEIAGEAGLRGWELDRLLYGYTDHFLAVISASGGERRAGCVDVSDEEEMTPERVEETKRHALEAARQRLPCPNCGSNDEPIPTKPKRGTADWWDDPSVYVGCASCGRFLGDLPSVHPYIWQAEKEFD